MPCKSRRKISWPRFVHVKKRIPVVRRRGKHLGFREIEGFRPLKTKMGSLIGYEGSIVLGNGQAANCIPFLVELEWMRFVKTSVIVLQHCHSGPG